MHKRRQKWLKINGPCVKCGGDINLNVDHIDPTTKISHSVWSWSEKRRNEELAKCQVLCSVCHKNKTRKEREVAVPHGTDCAYTHHKCRCFLCRKAHTKKRKQDRLLYNC